MPVMPMYVNCAIDIHCAKCKRCVMSEPNSERIITPMPPSLVQLIDDYRFKNRVASRAEAIRQLILKGLAAAEK